MTWCAYILAVTILIHGCQGGGRRAEGRATSHLDWGAQTAGGFLDWGAQRFGNALENSGLAGHIDTGANHFGAGIDKHIGPKSEAYMNEWGSHMAQKMFPEKFAKHYGRSIFFPGKNRPTRSPHRQRPHHLRPGNAQTLPAGIKDGVNPDWFKPDSLSGRGFLRYPGSSAHTLPAGIGDGVIPHWFLPDAGNGKPRPSRPSNVQTLPAGIGDGVNPDWFQPDSLSGRGFFRYPSPSHAQTLPAGIEDGVNPHWFLPDAGKGSPRPGRPGGATTSPSDTSKGGVIAWVATSSPAVGTSKAVPPITRPGTYGIAGRATYVHVFPLLNQLNGGKDMFFYKEGVKVHKGKELIDQEIQIVDGGKPTVTKDIHEKKEQKYDTGFHFAIGRK